MLIENELRTNYHESRNYTGTFQVSGEEFRGELVYCRESGKISLNLAKELFLDMRDDDPDSYTSKEIRKEFDHIESIPGKLDAGEPIVLFNCKCARNVMSNWSRDLRFQADYMIWNDAEAEGRKYSRFICVLENALQWSELSQIDYGKGAEYLKFTALEKYPRFNWYGAKITFGTSLDNTWFYKYQENTHIVERLQFAIQADEEKEIDFFLEIRDKVMAMISYAIKDNLNIASQYLIHKDDIVRYPEGSDYQPARKEYLKYAVLTNEPFHIVDPKPMDEYNFTLSQLPQDGDLSDKLDALTPVFNLYLSLFKYKDMPIEMVFLNMIQAVETFHARFFYDDEKNNRFQLDINEQYKQTPIPEFIFDGGSGGKKVKLAPRIKHMLIHPKNKLLWDFCQDGGVIATQIVDTRNYYTHYGPKRKKKAVQGKDLEFLIDFLALLLEYHIHEQLNLQMDGKCDVVAEDDYSDYGRYMKRVIQERDYLAAHLPIDLTKYNT